MPRRLTAPMLAIEERLRHAVGTTLGFRQMVVIEKRRV